MNEHDCIKKEQIEEMKKDVEHLSHRVNGYEEEPGIYADIKTIIRNQKKNLSWVMGSVFTFTPTFLFIAFVALMDHFKISDMPYRYIDRVFINQVLENQSKLNYMLQTADLQNTKDIEAINKQLQMMNKQFDFMRVTRGGEGVKKNPIKLSDGTDPEKEYQESIKNKK